MISIGSTIHEGEDVGVVDGEDVCGEVEGVDVTSIVGDVDGDDETGAFDGEVLGPDVSR